MISITSGLQAIYNSNMKEKTPLELEKENRLLRQQITQLTNNWNELEEWLKDFKRLYEGNEFQNNAKFCITVDQALDKMKEIKEGKNVSNRD